MATNSTSNLPMGLLEDILLRLPANDLVRFKVVCKTWKTLIGNPRFILKHHHHNVRNSKPKSLFITAYDHLNTSSNVVSLYTLAGSNPDPNPNPKPYPFPGRAIRTLSMADGLVFLELDSICFLWNPLTRTFKKTTPPPTPSGPVQLGPVRVSPRVFLNSRVHGFGFDPVSGDYKFVSCKFMTDSINELSFGMIRVYSKRFDSWVEFTTRLPPIHQASVTDGYSSGSYYWFGSELKQNGSMGPTIVSFNFGTKLLQVNPLPMELGNLRGGGVVICDRGRLGFVVVLGDVLVEPRRCEMWVSGSGSGSGSGSRLGLGSGLGLGGWTRTMSFGLRPEIKRPRGLWDGGVVFETRMDHRGERKLLLCNPCLGTCKEIRVKGFEFCVFKYVETLLSLSV